MGHFPQSTLYLCTDTEFDIGQSIESLEENHLPKWGTFHSLHFISVLIQSLALDRVSMIECIMWLVQVVSGSARQVLGIGTMEEGR